MAARKTSSWTWAAIHVALYVVPFTLCFRLWERPAAFLVMAGTHLVIDRFRLARYWCEFYGIGQPSRAYRRRFEAAVVAVRAELLAHNEEITRATLAEVVEDRLGMIRPSALDAPDYLKTWLLIFNDNIWHLAINAACLAYL